MSGQVRQYTSVEVCAGAGGQAVGLHAAGFTHKALIEIDPHACATLNHNVDRLGWSGCKVLEEDLNSFKVADLELAEVKLDLLAGGVPCPPFSLAGKQLGREDERDLFPAMLRMVHELKPRAVMIENVRGLLQPAHKFADYREYILEVLRDEGYTSCGWDVLEARDYGVPQLRPRAILVAMREPYAAHFQAPRGVGGDYTTVAEALKDSMAQRFGTSARGRKAFQRWLDKAELRGGVAPTLVGGSKKHGGADLGPTRAKKAWAELGIDAMGVADDPDAMKDKKRDLYGKAGPKLTVAQAALIQGFPADWEFMGRKTAAYRQVGNAFPPPVARAVGERILAAIKAGDDGAVPPAERSLGLLPPEEAPRQLALTV
ncbi:DNA (cytosine-5)-methyltransferase 1 [Murinocardiopsis flavida]|uniref:Cytosine-specific methyltransferase n=1 Tax=Murinocardiopsis flavida TaxID=645275 RepID=A0A2P8CWQ0_9ACTN|nr:DNA (cytosine-5-)-methyltransferase [Murinocardiopsis flavida]PSK89369.1 DNA (cytosine-5)-methyltransferase 1 [Murinocardiopsis flavida]